MRIKKLGIIILITLAVCAVATACGSGEKTKLSAPQNVHAEQRVLVWDEVKNAAGYVVRYENTEYETSENRYDLSELTEPKTYEIKVLAAGDNKNNSDSEWATFSYTVIEPVQHGYGESGLEYTLLADGTGYEVSRGKCDLNGVVSIPDYFYTLPVKRIAKDAFCLKIGTSMPNPFTESMCNIVTTGIRLPSRLETIGEYAFSCMVKLTEVVIPDTVTEMERFAFEGCKNLKRVTMPKELKVIPESCFQNCALEEVIFPDELEEISLGAFTCYLPLNVKWQRIIPTCKKIEIPNTVKRIGRLAFGGWLNLEEITVSSGLEWLDDKVFADTAWYDSQPDGIVMFGDILYAYKGDMEENAVIEIPSNVKKIAGGAFERKKTLTEVVIPDGVKLIGKDTFSNCILLSSIRLPNDLTLIPKDTFIGCNSLVSVEIPNSVKVIGYKAFYACPNLTHIYYNGTEAEWTGVKYINAIGDESPIDKMPIGDATVCYYSETSPTTDGNYWHYVDNKPTLW